ncbi:hypothetical protein PsorP6_010360 [Peronosclerospora sorghi]|uniref:Uncharacterized protein n=1 Tax=Peronosclerospora sorghi TaxID=230839 RepID=A0ACC0VVZ2_9STRA|nr:hypothetical protein PsorP6_010360 [Peronosclerospora sorghi]
MGDDFLQALCAVLEQTQRPLSRDCLLCVPPARALLPDQTLTHDMLSSHVLTREDERHALGEYRTLNGTVSSMLPDGHFNHLCPGKHVTVRGSHVHTGKRFRAPRQVRILVSEKRTLRGQDVTVLHLSRALEGGLDVPDDLSVIDVATCRKYTAMVRSFPEHELVFLHLDETIRQVTKLCAHEHVYERSQATLPANVREEWEAGVEDLIRAGSFDDKTRRDDASHVLQLEQVVECYLMEKLHPVLFPRVVASSQAQDHKLRQVMDRMRFYTPEDFGLRKEFQCFMGKARDTLLRIVDKKTPLEMLFVLKTCIDEISDAMTQNLQLRRVDVETYQLTTDDILDQLLFVLVQVFNQVTRTKNNARVASAFPLVAVMKYISDYHFINSNTTALGFSLANFQVAVEYFLMRGDHEDDCKDCAAFAMQGESAGVRCLQVIAASKCEQAAHGIRRDLTKSVDTMKLVRRDTGTQTKQESSHPNVAGDVVSTKRMAIIGAWSTSPSDCYEENDDYAVSTGSLAVHPVEFMFDSKQSSLSDNNILQVSAGQRFFASVLVDGQLITWGDSSGGRLGYALADGESRRVTHPRRVVALKQRTITQVSCGGFHALATDVNGYVFAWGSNTRGQVGLVSSVSATIVQAPSIVESLRGVYVNSVACGEYHSLALSSDGCVFSWGCNKYGQLGRPTENLVAMKEPGLVETDWAGTSLDIKSRKSSREPSTVRRIAAGNDHSLAISSDRTGFSWGRGDSGQLGHGCYMDVSEPRQVMALSAAAFGLVEVAGGKEFSLFRLVNGTVYICGRDPSLDMDNLFLSPVQLSLPSPLERDLFEQITAVSCGETHYALLSESGALVVSFASHSVPSPTAGSTTTEVQERRVTWLQEAGVVQQMDCGASHTLVVR